MDGYDPVFLEEDEELDYLAPVIFNNRYMDYSEHILPIIFQLWSLILVDHIFHGELI